MGQVIQNFVMFALGAIAMHGAHSLYHWWKQRQDAADYWNGWDYAAYCYERAMKPTPEKIYCKRFAAGMQDWIDDMVASGGANPAQLVGMGMSPQLVEHLIATRRQRTKAGQ